MPYSLFRLCFIHSTVVLQNQIVTGFDICWKALFGKKKEAHLKKASKKPKWSQHQLTEKHESN